VPGTAFLVAATGQPLRGVATRCGSPSRCLTEGLGIPGIAGQLIEGWPGWRLLAPNRAAHRGPHAGKDAPLGYSGILFELRGVLGLRGNAPHVRLVGVSLSVITGRRVEPAGIEAITSHWMHGESLLCAESISRLSIARPALPRAYRFL